MKSDSVAPVIRGEGEKDMRSVTRGVSHAECDMRCLILGMYLHKGTRVLDKGRHL